ncbi:MULTISPECIES: hypothetical protein [unclassified Bradyrhizobium]|uniref:hypothetical protein n=1 Tax=unclassified Bradyrhizobium TaxID=2631580 RepID=UPI0028EF50BF|nr:MULTISPECIES: hypothetical protein [unclassified Bradyrhizobium]
MTNDLDLEDLKLPGNMVQERAVASDRIKKRRLQFVQVPLIWIDKIARDSRDKTFAVLCHLLHEDWKQGGGPIKVANGFLGKLGVGRGAKSRALSKLENLGIISVERRGRKSPIIRINRGSELTPAMRSSLEAGHKIGGVSIGEGSPEGGGRK